MSRTNVQNNIKMRKAVIGTLKFPVSFYFTYVFNVCKTVPGFQGTKERPILLSFCICFFFKIWFF